MTNVRIKFSVEVDGEYFAEHTAEYQSVYALRHPLETDEEKLATDIINQINKLVTSKKLKLNNWDKLFGENILKEGMAVSHCD